MNNKYYLSNPDSLLPDYDTLEELSYLDEDIEIEPLEEEDDETYN